MPVVQYLGRVAPAYPALNVHLPAPINAQGEGGPYLVQISIAGSQVLVTCEGEHIDLHKGDHAFRMVHDLTRTFVNVLSFREGVGATLVFDYLRDTDGMLKPIRYASPGGKDTASFAGQADLLQIFTMAMGENLLRQALHDLIQAESAPIDTAVNAHRAVERIRRQLADEDMTEGAAWGRLREALLVDRPYVQFISDASKVSRHGGDPGEMSQDNTEALQRARTIVDRYIAYRVLGAEEFAKRHELLTGDAQLPVSSDNE